MESVGVRVVHIAEMCISLPAVATQSAVLPTWQHFAYQLVVSRGVTSLVANETSSRSRQLRTLPCCRGSRWLCACVCIHAAQRSELPHQQLWEFSIREAERYIHEIFVVVSKYSHSKTYCWAAFWPQFVWKDWDTPCMTKFSADPSIVWLHALLLSFHNFCVMHATGKCWQQEWAAEEGC